MCSTGKMIELSFKEEYDLGNGTAVIMKSAKSIKKINTC